MNVSHEWMARLLAQGVELRRSGDKLKVSAPSGVLTGTDIEILREHKAEIFAWLDAPRQGVLSDAPAERTRGAHAVGGLSFSEYQLPFWYLENEQPGSGMLNIPVGFRIKGPLDTVALETSLRVLRERHEAIRSVVTEEGGTPAWRLLDAESLAKIPVLETETLPNEKALNERLRDIAATKFRVEEEPLLRFFLITLAKEDHVLVMIAHHLAVDGESLAILIQEFRQLYAARIHEMTPELPESPRLAGILNRDRAWLASEGASREMDYWREALSGELPSLELPADHARPAAPSAKGGQVRLSLNASEWNALRQLAAENRATGFMGMLALITASLSAIGGRNEIVIGLPVSLRGHGELEKAVGLMMNTVALRLEINPHANFQALIGEVRDRTIAALEHQHLPIERVVQAVRPRRDASRTPLYQVLLGFQPNPHSKFDIGGVRFETFDIPKSTAQTDIAFWYNESDDGLDIVLEYSRDLFEQETANRIAGHVLTNLKAVLDAPERALNALPVMSDDEYRRVMDDWAMGPPLSVDVPFVDELVIRQAKQTPAAVAISQGERQLGYAELNASSERIANHLAKLGVKPGELIGVMVRRTPELLPLLLGILRAGGAYVPLDPDYPVERRGYMLEDSNARLLIKSADLPNDLPEFSGTLIDLESLLSKTPDVSAPSPDRSPDDPAYVIYTSGSTGKPKGVVVPHRTVSNFLSAMRHVLELDATDRVLALTTLSFDIAVLELFLPLVCGARTEIVERDTAVEGQRLRERISQYQPTLMQATPAGWQMLLASGWQGSENLTVLSGGEALPAPLARDLLARSKRVINMYGPTETTVWSSCHAVTGSDDPVPIGRPIANTSMYVLDEQRRPVPPGSSGELYIGGAGVTTGYLNRPELTAERFIPDPFSKDENARLYRTGDRVRFRTDGALEYFGRLDNQVKLRGYRIEPGEIEAELLAHSAIESAAVVAKTLHTPAGDDVRLVAYLVLRGNERLAIGQLREHLAKELPAYMIPQHFIAVDELPLTPSGKVDRKALPSPLAGGEAPRAFEPPRTPMEREIAAIWQELLGTEHAGRQDNFFDLGGHSLLSMQVIARIRTATGVRLRPRVLILNTLAEISAACEAAAEESRTEKVRSQRPFSSLIRRLWQHEA